MTTVHDDLAALGLSPTVGDELRRLLDEIWACGVSPRVLELCRLRMAQLVGADAELARRHPAAAGAVDEDDVAALPAWPTSARFDEGERAAIAFAEKYVIDAHSVTDGDCERLNEHYTPVQLAGLTTGLAAFDALARVEVGLGVSTGGGS